MPPSDELPALGRVWDELCRGRVALTVGPRVSDTADAVPDLGALPAGARVTALCWSLPTPPPLPALRVLLSAAGVLAIVATPARGALSRLLSRRPASYVALDALCTELVLRGFITPSCTPCADGALLVHAAVPSRAHWLDAFFEQPLTARSR